MVILLRAPLMRPTAIERLCKKRREPDRLPESAPTARNRVVACFGSHETDRSTIP